MVLSRDVKLNIIIALLVVQLMMFWMFMNNRLLNTSCQSPRANQIPVVVTEQPKRDVPLAEVQPVTQKPILATIKAAVQQNQPLDCGSIPADNVLYTLSHKDLAQLYHTYVTSIQFTCHSMVRHGSAGDGGWDVCIAPPFDIKQPCVVYSFGIRNDWTFDESITKTYGCDVHAYDPSISGVGLTGKPNIFFHKEGLDGADRVNNLGWQMHTFSSMLTSNGHSQTNIDILKIDIETSEWEAFPQMIQSGALKNVRQFSFEIHIKLNPQKEPDSAKYIKGLKLMKDLYHEGFRIFKTHQNPDTWFNSMYHARRTGCHELNMVRVNSGTSGCP